jgi:DNA uptake protein ComE-like DNA-binding protein
MRQRRHWLTGLTVLALVLAFAPSPGLARRKKADQADAEPAAKTAPASGAKVDLNTASEQELEGLPGIGPSTAKKIIAGRPYSSVADLSKAGVSAKTIDKIAPLVSASGAAAAPAAERRSTRTRAPKEAAAEPAGGTIDLNTASEKELETLPGVGPATAKKIVAGRPYASAADLAKAGVSRRVIDQISPRVTASGGRAEPVQPPPPAPAPPQAARVPPPAPAPSPRSVAPPSAGMVWVNLDTKVFHREGDRWYGNTKHGQYMTESDALAAGYRESKQHPKQ